MPGEGEGEVPAHAALADLLRSPFDAVLSDPTRLRLQAALHGLPAAGAMTFTALRKALALSDGNLGAHLGVLVEVGYVDTETSYRGKRRTTFYRASAAGRAAFREHVEALQAVIAAAELRG